MKVLAVWSNADGIEECQIQLTSDDNNESDDNPELYIGVPRQLLQLGEPQPRYPLVVRRSPDTDIVDITWTTDRQKLQRSSIRRNQTTADAIALPGPCHGNERLVALDAATLSATTSVLIALTDRGRILVSRWDTAVDQYNTWTSVIAPVTNVTAIATISPKPGRNALFAVTAQGKILCVELRETLLESWPWRSLGLPDGVPTVRQCTSLAAATTSVNHGRLFMVCDGKTWVIPVAFSPDHAQIGAAHRMSFKVTR